MQSIYDTLSIQNFDFAELFKKSYVLTSAHESTTVRRNFDHLNSKLLLIKCDVIGWKSVDGWKFVVSSEACTSVLWKEDGLSFGTVTVYGIYACAFGP